MSKIQFIDTREIPLKYTQERTAKIILNPVPYDVTSTWIKGADKGPDALFEAAQNLEFYDIETNSEVYKLGIHTAKPLSVNKSPAKMTEAVFIRTKSYLNKDKFVVTVGGDHSVSIGAIKAHCSNFSNVSVLQLDAHTDLRQVYHRSKYNHACVMARAKELAPIVQIGIRSMDLAEKQYVEKDRIFYAEDIYQNNNWFDAAISKLTDNVYLTIDLDVFDPSIMPSTGTPEPGGLLWYQVITFLKKVIAEKQLVGFDVVELCPNQYNKAPDFLAAKLIYKLLSYKFSELV